MGHTGIGEAVLCGHVGRALQRRRFASDGFQRQHDANRVLNSLVQLGLIQQQVEARGADGRQLAQNDVPRHALHVVRLGVHRSIHEDLAGFLEGTAHQRASVHTIDAMARHWRQLATGCA